MRPNNNGNNNAKPTMFRALETDSDDVSLLGSNRSQNSRASLAQVGTMAADIGLALYMLIALVPPTQ